MIRRTMKAVFILSLIVVLVACSGPGPADKPVQVAPADQPIVQAPSDEKPPESVVPPAPEGPGDVMPPVIGELGPQDQEQAEWRCPPDCYPASQAIQSFLTWTTSWLW